MQAVRQTKPSAKTARNPRKNAHLTALADCKDDASVLAKIQEAEKQGTETRPLVETLMQHLLKKSDAEKKSAAGNLNQSKTDLAEIIDKLPPRRQVFLRLLHSGLNYKQISAEFGVAHLTVKVTAVKLRKQLGPIIVPVLRNDKSR